ncbi:hypothetical protein LLG96_05520 [bacterium]|nr:hypothetical protein [bacterium]
MDALSSEKSSTEFVKQSNNTKLYVFIGLLVVLAALSAWQFWSINNKNNQISVLQQEKLAGETEQQKLKASITEITDTINEVANKLQDVRKKQVAISDIVTRSEVNNTQKAQIINDITAIEGQLQQDKKDVEGLLAKMKKTDIRIKSLEKMVTSLKKEIEKNEKSIAELRSTIEEKDVIIKNTQYSLKTTEDNLKVAQGDLDQTRADLQDTRNVLEETRNTAYYVIGSKDELKAENILSESGRFYQKKSVDLAGEFDTAAFTKIDITKQKVFAVNCSAKDVKLFPLRSDSSYKLEETEKGKSVLTVVNPEKFWKIPYVAIVVKG